MAVRDGWLWASVFGLCGCAASADVSEQSHRIGNYAAAAGSPAAGGGNMQAGTDGSAGAPGTDNGSGLIPITVNSSADAGQATDAAVCGASSYAAQQVVVETEVDVATQVTTVKPLSLYIMFDQSLSMGWSNIWAPAVSALKSFVQDDKSKGIAVGLQYFPLSSGGSCSTGTGYITPAVKVGTLPAQATDIASSLDAHSPNGVGTPLEGALRGVTGFCEQYQTDHPDEQCVAVLVTDGKPEFASGCSENSQTLAGIAKSAHDAGVTTFAVGLTGADFNLLDQIAMQGGAPDCDTTSSAYACNVSADASKLGDALNAIRDTVVTTETHTETVKQTQQTALPCEWAVPANSESMPFDSNKVNIRFSQGSAQTTFVRVNSADSCRDDAWYFDNASEPTRMLACPTTCDAIKASSDAKIDVLLGCATIVPG
jgi:hypothetical protein